MYAFLLIFTVIFPLKPGTSAAEHTIPTRRILSPARVAYPSFEKQPHTTHSVILAHTILGKGIVSLNLNQINYNSIETVLLIIISIT